MRQGREKQKKKANAKTVQVKDVCVCVCECEFVALDHLITGSVSLLYFLVFLLSFFFALLFFFFHLFVDRRHKQVKKKRPTFIDLQRVNAVPQRLGSKREKKNEGTCKDGKSAQEQTARGAVSRNR